MSTNIKIFVYKIPRKFRPTKDLPLVSETFYEIEKHIKKELRTKNPKKADLFFVPINLIQYQFNNEDPKELLNNLKYLSNKKDHFIVALGDFSNRGTKNKYGEAYSKPYKWLDKFGLLALESTSDLDKEHDIGIIPLNTLPKRPKYNENKRIYLYSFLGELNHVFLPETHIRNKVGLLDNVVDVFIGDEIKLIDKKKMLKKFRTKNNYELISRNSTFTLCPAGYGRWTYRFFQAIEWGSIPVLLSDDYVKPFSDKIPYDKFSLTIKEKDIKNIDKIIRSISANKIEEMQIELKSNQQSFTKNNFFKLLDKELERLVKYA